jgi:hypothetical protein
MGRVLLTRGLMGLPGSPVLPVVLPTRRCLLVTGAPRDPDVYVGTTGLEAAVSRLTVHTARQMHARVRWLSASELFPAYHANENGPSGAQHSRAPQQNSRRT